MRSGKPGYLMSAARVVLAACVLFAAPTIAQAAQTQTTFTVTATVVAACAVSAGNLAFGSYDPTSATPNDKQSTLNVTCTNGTPYAIGLNAGGGSGATVAARKMADEVKGKMVKGEFIIFKGGLKDNKGAVVIPAGKNLKQTDLELEKMNYLVAGVVGSIPG